MRYDRRPSSACSKNAFGSQNGCLLLLFVDVNCYGKDAGFSAWQTIEALRPEKDMEDQYTLF